MTNTNVGYCRLQGKEAIVVAQAEDTGLDTKVLYLGYWSDLTCGSRVKSLARDEEFWSNQCFKSDDYYLPKLNILAENEKIFSRDHCSPDHERILNDSGYLSINFNVVPLDINDLTRTVQYIEKGEILISGKLVDKAGGFFDIPATLEEADCRIVALTLATFSHGVEIADPLEFVNYW